MSLFTGQHISNYFNRLEEAIKNKIYEYDYRQLKDFSDADIGSLVEYYKVHNVEVDFDEANVQVKNDKDEIFNYDSQIFDDEPEYKKVKGKRFFFHALINGEWSLLKYDLGEQSYEMINYHDENYERMDISLNASIGKHDVSFQIFVPDFELENKTKEEVLQLLNNKKETFLQTTNIKLKRLNSIINCFNKNLDVFIKNTIKSKIDDDSSLEFISNIIGVEVNPKNELQEKGAKIELLPKKVDIFLPDRKKYDGFYLDRNNYSAIITTIRNHLASTESNPKAIIKLHDEELIRDTILWALNSNYFVASGETFRSNGKTDILINFNDKSVFIAECKIWKGKQYIEDGITQLLSYSTWRDSKLALIIFNMTNQDFFQICNETKNIIKSDKSFKRFLDNKEDCYFECELEDKNNSESSITLAVILANYVGR